jgi:hypothetical protein
MARGPGAKLGNDNKCENRRLNRMAAAVLPDVFVEAVQLW